MGVKKNEELLIKVAYMFSNNKATKEMLTRAAILYARSKSKACERRDLWKMRKRLGGKDDGK